MTDESTRRGPSLDDVNDDCLILLIMSHLPSEDLNTFAFCGHRYREARRHPSLDQTRSGTIIVPETTTLHSLFDTIEERGWNEVFRGNRTHLKVLCWTTGAALTREYMSLEISELGERLPDVQLTEVTGLCLFFSQGNLSRVEYFKFCYNVIWAFSSLLPNLEIVDLSGVELRTRLVHTFCTTCSSLAKVTLCRLDNELYLDGRDFKDASNLTELNLDGSSFCLDNFASYMTTGDSTHYLLMQCTHLERLSIRNVEWKDMDGDAIVMKFVRHHPTLRWLRSDLNETNVAILKLERPYITFA